MDLFGLLLFAIVVANLLGYLERDCEQYYDGPTWWSSLLWYLPLIGLAILASYFPEWCKK